eukprot:11572345-Alexandrium_andersonii.AAC.1
MAVEERYKDAKTPQQLLDSLEVAHPLGKGRFMRQAYGRDVWNTKIPVKPNDVLDGVYKFSVPLMESL